MNYKLKEIRVDEDLTQQVIADKLNVGRSTYEGWENEIDNIPLLKFNDFCNEFNVSMDYAANLTNVSSYKNIISKKINPKVMGKRLEIIRKELNLLQKDFAKELSISPSTYINYKRGDTIIQTLILREIAIKNNYSMDWITGRSDQKSIGK